MYKRVNRRKTVLAAAALAAAGMATGGVPSAAFAAPAPKFLSAGELPSGDRFGEWRAGPVKSGLPRPQYTCVKDVLPEARTTFRKYSSDLDAEAQETVTVLPDVASAKLAAKKVAQAVERCAAKVVEDTTWKKYGTFDVEEGLSVYGVFFAPPGSEYTLQLFGIGRDGRKVVVVALGMQGRTGDAPVKKFTTTAKRALTKAF